MLIRKNVAAQLFELVTVDPILFVKADCVEEAFELALAPTPPQRFHGLLAFCWSLAYVTDTYRLA